MPAAALCVTPAAALGALDQGVAGVVGCPAHTPSVEALGLTWRLRADAHLLAASNAGASADPALRADARRLRRRGQAWAAGARRLEGCSARRAAWLQRYLEQLVALPDASAAYEVMPVELAVWRLARLVQRADTRPGRAG